MSKASAKESTPDEDEEQELAPAIPVGAKNYITPQGHARLKDEALHLLDK